MMSFVTVCVALLSLVWHGECSLAFSGSVGLMQLLVWVRLMKYRNCRWLHHRLFRLPVDHE